MAAWLSDENELRRILAMVEEAANAGYWLLDPDRELVEWSANAFRIHGREPGTDPVTLREAVEAYVEEDRDRVLKAVQRGVRRGEPFSFKARLTPEGSDVRHVEVSGRPATKVKNGYRIFGVLRDVSEYQRNEEQLRKLADTDPLTGAHNVRSLHTLIEQEVSRMKRMNHPTAIAIVDLDSFKLLNDTQGHGAGDRALCEFVRITKTCLREDDVIARIGGDEFAIMMSGADPDQARVPLSRIQKGLNAVEGLADLTFCAGISSLKPGRPLADVLKEADDLLYEAKRGGAAVIISQDTTVSGPAKSAYSTKEIAE